MYSIQSWATAIAPRFHSALWRTLWTALPTTGMLLGMGMWGGARLEPQSESQWFAQPAIAAQRPPSDSARPASTRYWQRRTLWRTVEVAEGGFQILMPEQPQLHRHRVIQSSRRLTAARRGSAAEPAYSSRQTVTDVETAQYITAVQRSFGALYMVGWSPIEPQSLARPAAQLEAEREALLSRFGGQLLREEAVYFEGAPGQHYQLLSRIGDETYIITHRAYWLSDRLYQMTVAVPQERYPGFIGMAEGFMRSFQLN